MSLVFKALQVICVTREEPKEWEMNGRKGVSHTAMVCCLGNDGKAANIKLKAAAAEELTEKISCLTIGKPYDLPVVEVVPIFKANERRPSAYELVASIKAPLAAKKAA